MKEIRNITFDLGKVLLTNDSHGLATGNLFEARELLESSTINLKKSWAKNWLPFRKGIITEDDFFSRFIKDAGCKASDELIDQMKGLYRSKIEALPLYSALTDLEKRYHLYAVTNISKEWLDFKNRKFALDEHFKGITSSGYEGLTKPGSGIFIKFIEKYQINPQETIYIDDQWWNLIAPFLLRFNVILFKNKEQTINRLKQFGVRI